MPSKINLKKMLDDKNGISALDPSSSFQDELAFAENMKKAVKNVKALDLPKELKIGRHTVRYTDVDKIVFAGMGGSAIAGDVLKDWAESFCKVPMEAVRGYHLPDYVDKDTLVFLVSYSGDTEETLSCMLGAAKKSCKMVCISSNGAMQRAAKTMKLPILGLPRMAAARVSFPYLLAPIPYVMAKMKLLPDDKVEKEVAEATETIEKLTKEYAIERAFEKNYAKQAALQIYGTVPVIYSYSQYRSVGLRFKTQVNENCKLPARCDVFPELDHNEIMGWEASKQILKHYTLILLRGPEEPEEVKARIEVLKQKFFTGARGMVEIQAEGQSTLARMLHLLFKADMISLYLAVLLGRDPVASKTFQILKYRMTERLGTLARIEEEIKKLALE